MIENIEGPDVVFVLGAASLGIVVDAFSAFSLHSSKSICALS